MSIWNSSTFANIYNSFCFNSVSNCGWKSQNHAEKYKKIDFFQREFKGLTFLTKFS